MATTRDKLDASLDAYRRGDRDMARQLAIGAYLEGFELVEASLDNVDAPLRREVETRMMALRTTIAQGLPAAEGAAQGQHPGRAHRRPAQPRPTGACRDR